MSNLEQRIDLDWYPSKGIRRVYRQTIYRDGEVAYDIITETDTRYECVEVTEGQYYTRLLGALECQRKRSAARLWRVIDAHHSNVTR